MKGREEMKMAARACGCRGVDEVRGAHCCDAAPRPVEGLDHVEHEDVHAAEVACDKCHKLRRAVITGEIGLEHERVLRPQRFALRRELVEQLRVAR
jgi:hypothetical protein